jgi:hypothetical protein
MKKATLAKLRKNLQNKINFFPHKHQKTILSKYEDHREVIICAGRRFGKSSLCGYVILEEIMKADLEGNPIKVWVVAPTYDLTRKVFDYLIPWFIKVFPSQKGNVSYSENRPPKLKTERGSIVEGKSSSEAQQLLGEEVDLIVVDEAPLVSDRVYQQNLLPTVMGRKGKMIFIGTPRGKGWFYNLYLELKDEGQAFNFSSLDGKSVTKEELNRIEGRYPDNRLFRQEYFAEFIANAGQVFLDIDKIVIPKDVIYKPFIKTHHYLIGVDIAETEDFTVITVIDTHTNSVVYWKRFKGVDYPAQIEQIIATANEYGGSRIVIDTTGVGKPIYEMLLKRGVFVEDFTFTGKSKEELIQKLRLYISQKWISIPNEPVLLDELNSFEYKLRNEKTGEPLKNIKYGAPKGYHDDCVDSLALAVWELQGKAHPRTRLQEELQQTKTIRKRENFI